MQWVFPQTTAIRKGRSAIASRYVLCRKIPNDRARTRARPRRLRMTVTALLVVLFVLLLIGALPVYPYSRNWGYYPSGTLAVAVAVVALMLLL
jgi:Protein of unknown function (DUF3309)